MITEKKNYLKKFRSQTFKFLNLLKTNFEVFKFINLLKLTLYYFPLKT